MTAPHWLLHVDVDQFQAAVELRRRPELRGRAVVVGGAGDPNERRAVVTCASYEARAVGVRAGMPIRMAARRCPEAAFLALDPAAYDAASAQVMNVLRTFTPIVEPFGWEEAFVAADTDDPMSMARAVQDAVRERVGLGCSVGVGDSRQRAKLATGFGKPGGIGRLTAQTWLPVMGERSTDALWGIGARVAARLAEHGVLTVADLAAAGDERLAAWFGPTIGPRLGRLGTGEDGTDLVVTPRVPVSRGRQETLPADLTDPAEIAATVLRLAREVTTEVVTDGRVVARVAVTVRTASFHTRTKITKLASPSTETADVERAALRVLDRFTITRPVRLLGVRLELVPLD
jgi:DNA polymerase-4